MAETKAESTRIGLPLVAQATERSAPAWRGWTPLTLFGEPPGGAVAADAPEPLEPQGEYGTDGLEIAVPQAVAGAAPHRPVELLAPAGGPEAAFAAFHFGADAIYLGLQKFSARAEAENFTLEQVGEVTAYAHSLEPRRRVFVTVNTLIRQDELPELIEALASSRS